ncbi:amino acid permease [bacterium]
MKLKKSLTLIDVFCIASGAMISSGLFILPGIAHAQAGPAVIFSYFFAGLLGLTGTLSQSELVSAMPKTGGTYFYITRSMGTAAGTIDGLITWFSLSLKTAFALIGMAAFTRILINLNAVLIGIILCIIFIITNIKGIKEAGRIQRILVISLLAILFYYIIHGIQHINVTNFTPFMPFGIASVFSTAGLVFVSFGGLLKVASIAEEVKNPERTIPMGMIISLFVITIVYTLVVFVTSGVLGAQELDNSLTPISLGAQVFSGTNGFRLMSFAAILAFVSTANAGIMAASRYLTALSADGLIPKIFGNIHSKYKTPAVSIIFTGLCIIIALFFDLKVLVKMASTVLIGTFLFSCLAVIIMRESKVQNYAPKFKSPLYPWIQIIGIIGFAMLIIEMGAEAMLLFSVFISVGLFIYWFFGRIRATREYALLHLIERITAKELTSYSLETELKEIIQERDEIIKDRFDHIIEKSIVLDIEKAMGLEDFLKLAATELSHRLHTINSTLFKLLCEREKETSTVISPGIAIPHIIIEGKEKFDILLVRCKKGIIFPKTKHKVHTVFVLAGTKDERNFHLRALAAIAQILQSSEFKKKWLSARNEKALRDVILMGKRLR